MMFVRRGEERRQKILADRQRKKEEAEKKLSDISVLIAKTKYDPIPIKIAEEHIMKMFKFSRHASRNWLLDDDVKEIIKMEKRSGRWICCSNRLQLISDAVRARYSYRFMATKLILIRECNKLIWVREGLKGVIVDDISSIIINFMLSLGCADSRVRLMKLSISEDF